MAFTVGAPFTSDIVYIWSDNVALPRLNPSPRPRAGATQIGTHLRYWFNRDFARFEAAARPGDLNHRAMIRKGPVGKGDLGPGPFQQCAGDKHPETEARVLTLGFIRAAPRQIGLADPFQHIGRNPRPIVGNDDLD